MQVLRICMFDSPVNVQTDLDFVYNNLKFAKNKHFRHSPLCKPTQYRPVSTYHHSLFCVIYSPYIDFLCIFCAEVMIKNYHFVLAKLWSYNLYTIMFSNMHSRVWWLVYLCVNTTTTKTAICWVCKFIFLVLFNFWTKLYEYQEVWLLWMMFAWRVSCYWL